MNDDTANVTGPLSQMPGASQNQTSGIDDYQPPQDQGLAGDTSTTVAAANNPDPIAERQADLQSGSKDFPASDPVSAPAQTPIPAGQSLEDQNIFSMLGVTDGSEEERESFLDELQEVIWEDFLEKDVELLITKEEAEELRKIKAKEEPARSASSTADAGGELQEEIVNYLEKLIPDLEEIMLEKALELKEDMFRERISDMKDYYKDKQEILGNIRKAEDLIAQDKWKDAADALNAVK